jgi:hypothetical protein
MVRTIALKLTKLHSRKKHGSPGPAVYRGTFEWIMGVPSLDERPPEFDFFKSGTESGIAGRDCRNMSSAYDVVVLGVDDTYYNNFYSTRYILVYRNESI